MVTVLVTRLFLRLTDYPRVGGGGLHIAHLMWGGMLMLIGLVLVMSLLGKAAKRWAAGVGGVGFGLFVDELGKFVTADNNYFFQPTIALIYVIFVVLFLVFRAIERRSLSRHELLVNAADMLREVVLGGATRAEVVRARRLLDRSDFEGPLAEGLRQAIDGATRVPERRSPVAWLATRAWRTYDRLLDWPWFPRAVWLVFIVQALVGIAAAITVGWATLHDSVPALSDQAALATSLLSLLMVITGVAHLPTSRLAAYRWFERSVLISVFFTQVILFWTDQLTALTGLIWDLALLTLLRFLIRQEEARQALAEPPLEVRSPTAVTNL